MSKTIMSVDDCEYIRILLRQILQDAGYGVVEAADGVEALGKLSGVDMIITDMDMPGINGVQLARAVRDDPATRGLPIIMLSAINECDLGPAYRQSGINSYSPKPFDPDELLATIRTVMPQ